MANPLWDKALCAVMNANEQELDRLCSIIAKTSENVEAALAAFAEVEAATMAIDDADWQEHWQGFTFDFDRRIKQMTGEALPTADEARAHLDLVRRVGAALADGTFDKAGLDYEEAETLATLARSGDVAFLLFPDRVLHPLQLLVLTAAARGLYSIANGEVRLLRCPAPAPRHTTEKCGRFFVSGGREGRPARYCSPSCRQRAFRRHS